MEIWRRPNASSVEILQISFNIKAIKLIFHEIQYLAMLAVTRIQRIRIYPLADFSQHYSQYSGLRVSVHWNPSTDPGRDVIGASHPENLMSSSNLQKCQNVMTLKINILLLQNVQHKTIWQFSVKVQYLGCNASSLSNITNKSGQALIWYCYRLISTTCGKNMGN